MAEMTAKLAIMDRFGRRLATAIGDWEQLPEMAADWAEWDIDSRMDFLTDWPVVEERTASLLAMETSLPADDVRRARLRELRALMQTNRPILEQLEARIHEK